MGTIDSAPRPKRLPVSEGLWDVCCPGSQNLPYKGDPKLALPNLAAKVCGFFASQRHVSFAFRIPLLAERRDMCTLHAETWSDVQAEPKFCKFDTGPSSVVPAESVWRMNLNKFLGLVLESRGPEVVLVGGWGTGGGGRPPEAKCKIPSKLHSRSSWASARS